MSGKASISIRTIPWGLGWADRLARASLEGDVSIREAFQRRLFVGIAGATAVGLAGASAARFTYGSTTGGVVMAIGSVVALVCLLGFTASGKHLPVFINTLFVVAQAVTFVDAFSIGGLSGWTASVWLFAPMLVGSLVLGRSSGLFWLITALVMLALYAHLPRWGGLIGPLEIPPGTAADLLSTSTGSMGSFAVFTALVLNWFVQQRDIAEALTEIERKRADDLLHNVLPASVIERLKREEVVADHLEEVSVLFADLVGFTPMAAQLTARQLVEVLDDLFREMDALVVTHGLEKIKTIGDCYMVASGAPIKRADHALALTRLALEMRDLVNSRSFAGQKLGLRIGIHSGPVVAGVIGSKRQIYDLWGDTVNLASRLESSCPPGAVHVSAFTARFLKGSYALEDRGLVEIKGKGPTQTFVVAGQLS